ncbi:uncharacterized protein SAMN05421810_10129 [Amycolatopsis arida]|uniref:Metal-binding protein n=1 Tax=Amycolatopsis arida TaxID=587909 RepID=A0A1I5K7Z2_9PSEU|nr:YceD family protein [Amycolatopsis arida]TDX96925.1 uncharacterized protein CLV69_10227 [Amycolatopsis arida]SFO81107.1 uncharacterized protein SAMN05421810_10129 [Amycolatopsis arida]
MSEDKFTTDRLDVRSPWIVDTRELGRRAGLSRTLRRTAAVDVTLGVPDVITVPSGVEIELDLLLESVVEGVLVTGTATTRTAGQCSRCLDPIEGELTVDLTELFAYPDSTTEATTEEDEVSRLVDDLIDLQPVVRDAMVLALPLVPLCSADCRGLCAGCGVKWADLEPDHGHETIDPRWAALVERLANDETPASGADDNA